MFEPLPWPGSSGSRALVPESRGVAACKSGPGRFPLLFGRVLFGHRFNLPGGSRAQNR